MATTTHAVANQTACTTAAASTPGAIAAFVHQTGRRPSPTASDPNERRLGIWLDHRRRAHRQARLHAKLARTLDDAVPSWHKTAFPTAPARVTVVEVLAYHRLHGHWPKTTRGTAHERLGTWMQSRRREARLGTLDRTIAAALDEVDPTWRGTGTAGRPPQ